MKWNNKGHEYDEVYKNMKQLKEIYLFGAGHDGAMVKDILTNRYGTYEIKGFIDNDVKKQGTFYHGLKVYSLNEVSIQVDIGIVVTFASEFTMQIDKQLSDRKWEKHVNFFHYEEFISVLAAYQYDELFMSSICILPTTKCNLRCEACLNFTTYMKRFVERPLEKLKKEIDLFFENVNYVGLFFISGGEPLLYSRIAELVQYIDENYKDKIYSFETVTNGTVKPTHEFISVIGDSSLKITVDDYREAVPMYREDIETNLEQLKKVIGEKRVILRKYDEWIELYPHEQKFLKECELIEKYDRCHVPWQEYRDGKFYSCNYAAFASVAEIIGEPDTSETFDLSIYEKSKLKELMEFRLGYTEKGYMEFCKLCSGYLEINEHKVKPAIQKGI